MKSMKRFTFHNPKSSDEIKAVKNFYSEVSQNKTKLLNGYKLEDKQSVTVAKTFNDAHKYHELFNRVLSDFKDIEKPSFRDLQRLIKEAKNITNRAKGIETRLDG